jgi:hypothetical protein
MARQEAISDGAESVNRAQGIECFPTFLTIRLAPPMEMPRASLDLREIQRKQMRGVNRYYICAALLAMHTQEFAFVHQRAILLIYKGLHDYVAEVGFVMEC